MKNFYYAVVSDLGTKRYIAQGKDSPYLTYSPTIFDDINDLDIYVKFYRKFPGYTVTVYEVDPVAKTLQEVTYN